MKSFFWWTLLEHSVLLTQHLDTIVSVELGFAHFDSELEMFVDNWYQLPSSRSLFWFLSIRDHIFSFSFPSTYHGKKWGTYNFWAIKTNRRKTTILNTKKGWKKNNLPLWKQQHRIFVHRRESWASHYRIVKTEKIHKKTTHENFVMFFPLETYFDENLWRNTMNSVKLALKIFES